MNGLAAALSLAPRPPALLRTPFRGRRAEAASVTAGTALVGLQALQLGPLLSDDAAVTFASLGHPGAVAGHGAAGPVWLLLLGLGRAAGLFHPGHGDSGLFPLVLALLCTAGTLAAAGATARVLLGRPAWPVPLLAGAALAASPTLVGGLFSGLGTPLYVCAVALLARALAGGAARAWRECTPSAVGAGLSAALAVASVPADRNALVLAAAWPLTLLLAPGLPFSRERLAGAVRPAVCYLLAFGLPYAALPPVRRALLGHRPSAADAAAAGTGAGTGAVPMAVALIAAAIAGAALARRGRTRGVLAAVCVPPAFTAAAGGTEWALGALVTALAAAVVWRTEQAGGRLALSAALVCGMAVSLTAQPGGRQSAGAAETSLCYTGARYGDMFGEYARRLGLTHSTVALPEPGGALLAGDQQVLDLSGRTDPKVAAAARAGDAALRRYVLLHARPEFIHIEQPFIDRTGLTAAVLTAHGYRPLLREGDGGDFVARSAVTAPKRLPELRRWAEHAAHHARSHATQAGPACA
jgi:hypothetical protein